MDLVDFNIFGELDPEKAQWDALIEAAIAGNVVPVIGPDILCDLDGNSNINEFLISLIDKQLQLPTPHKTFSQLAYDAEFLNQLAKLFNTPSVSRNKLYTLVGSIFANQRNIERFFKPSDILKRILSIKQFPFVITTSFSPIVENTMREVWGNRDVKVLSFCNDPRKDTKVGIGDIGSAEDMNNPTIYYMFGKVPGAERSFVLTDDDMLRFCRSWMSESHRPSNLCYQLKDKYLLMLGCGYSDWLFRFIWFCMDKNAETKTMGLMAADERTTESLVEYLRRIDTFLPANKKPVEIVNEIERRLKEYNEQNHDGERFNRPPRTTQVFISYSRSDSVVAEKLYNFLTANGLNVWYDRNNLLGGSKFMDEIETAIENSKVFIPIITRNIDREAMDFHVYRSEWKKALELQANVGDRNFIIPIHEKGFNFYDAQIPKEMKSHNSIEFDDSYQFDNVLLSINEALNRLDKFKHNTLF